MGMAGFSGGAPKRGRRPRSHAQGTHCRSTCPIDVGSVVDVNDVYRSCAFLDAVNDPVGAAPGAMAPGEWTEQRLADPVRIDGECAIAEFERRRGYGLRQALGDCPASGRLKPHIVGGSILRRHAPVARRRARSARTVARSTPCSPRPNAAKLSEIRATDSLSPRISRVISNPSRSSTESRTASASPFRVRVIRSCCWRTRRVSSERRAFASDKGTGVAATVIDKIIVHIGPYLDQLTGKALNQLQGKAGRWWRCLSGSRSSSTRSRGVAP